MPVFKDDTVYGLWQPLQLLKKAGDCAAEIAGGYDRVHRFREMHSCRGYLSDCAETQTARVTLPAHLDIISTDIDRRQLFGKAHS